MKNLLRQFQSEIDSVQVLARFDEIIVIAAQRGFKRIYEICEIQQADRIKMEAEKHKKLFENLHNSGSTKVLYETIYNQCIVLLVSYFAASLEAIFRTAVPAVLRSCPPKSALDESLKMTIRQVVKTELSVDELICELIIAKDDVSFQDMKRIRETFKTFCNADIPRNEDVNNVIVGQASRNIIVHAGSRIDPRFLKQISNASPRTLKDDMPQSGNLRYTPTEVKLLGDSMLRIIEELVRTLENC